MKHLIKTAICVFFAITNGHAQTVYESIVSIEKAYAPLFGKEASLLSIALVSKYDLQVQDSSYMVIVKVNQATAETVGYSLGLSLFSSNFGSGGGVTGNRSYVFKKDEGLIVMGYQEFLDLYEAINNTYSHVSKQNQIKESDRSMLVTYQTGDMTFGGEYNPKAWIDDRTMFYIQVGDAAFKMSEFDFRNVAAAVRNMRIEWEKVLGVN